MPSEAALAFGRLIAALAAEPDPPTTVRAGEEAANVHVADSLAALEVPGLRSARVVADVGAGAGFPGLPLAAALPDARVDLIDSQRRKTEVIERLAAAAGLANARPVTARAEDWAAADGRAAYDAVVVRAVAPLPVLAEYASPLLAEGGVLVAWKGARDPAEEAAGDNAAARLALSPGEARAVEPYVGARNLHLHVFRKTGPTPPGFPRRAGKAAKRPLA